MDILNLCAYNYCHSNNCLCTNLFHVYFKISSCIQLWKLGTRCKSQIFNYTGSIHVIQHHAIKYNTIIYIAFIEIPPILMTFYVMVNYESDYKYMPPSIKVAGMGQV